MMILVINQPVVNNKQVQIFFIRLNIFISLRSIRPGRWAAAALLSSPLFPLLNQSV